MPKKGYKVIVNDISIYSNSIAKAVMSDDDIDEIKESNSWLDDYNRTYIKRASLFAGLIEFYGYNPIIPETLNDKLKKHILKYEKHLEKIKNQKVKAYKIYKEDLFNFIDKLKEEDIKVDVMFMDFAWPWRDGSKTTEYDTTANVFSALLNQNEMEVEMWDKGNVISNVIKAVEEAKKVSKYVLLSNQSSNYPTPEILEVALLKNGINYEIRHTMITDSEYEDNLGKEKFFREYLYVIKGNLN